MRLLRRTFGFARCALIAAALALAGTMPAQANLFFQQQTNVSCAACHHSGKEQAGRDGLTEVGQTFLACGYRLRDCFNPRTGRPITELLSAADLARVRLDAPGAAPRPPAPAAQPALAQPQPAAARTPPAGPYQQLCREAKVTLNGVTLYAICSANNGVSVHSALRNFGDCANPIFVDNGYLRCQLRGGGLSNAWRWFEIVNRQSALDITSFKVKLPNSSEDWKEWAQSPIRPNASSIFYFATTAPCLQRLRVGTAAGAEKDNVDTCRFRRLIQRDNDFGLE